MDKTTFIKYRIRKLAKDKNLMALIGIKDELTKIILELGRASVLSNKPTEKELKYYAKITDESDILSGILKYAEEQIKIVRGDYNEFE